MLPVINLIAYAQNAEDVILFRCFKDQKHGTYVDLGAGHPTFGSVTKNLAHKLNWNGVEIEPNSDLCDMLRKERSQSKVFNVAISDVNGYKSFVVAKENWAMSALADSADADQFAGEANTSEIEIETKTLDFILREANVFPGFDVLKADIEGAELKVFGNFDFDYWKPRMIVVEIVAPHSFARRIDLENIIIRAGYILCLFDGINGFFVRSGEQELVERLSYPAGIRDKYIPLVWWNILPEEIKSSYKHLL